MGNRDQSNLIATLRFTRVDRSAAGEPPWLLSVLRAENIE